MHAERHRFAECGASAAKTSRGGQRRATLRPRALGVRRTQAHERGGTVTQRNATRTGACSTVERRNRARYAARMSFAVRTRRLPRLFALALLAWLALTLSPLATASLAAEGMAATATPAMQHQDTSMHDAGCCADAGQPAHPAPAHAHACSCAMLCTMLLPTAALSVAAAPPASDTPAAPVLRDAPLSGFAPPLRPPLG